MPLSIHTFIAVPHKELWLYTKSIISSEIIRNTKWAWTAELRAAGSTKWNVISNDGNHINIFFIMIHDLLHSNRINTEQPNRV